MLTALLLSIFMNGSCQQKNTTAMNTKYEVNKTEDEWKKQLTPEQYNVLREKGTEAPYTGEYTDNTRKGVYVCAACGNELFTSDMKFKSHCGWPSFDRELGGNKVLRVNDFSHGMARTEILCARCGSHLGHVFDDGPTATGERYCVNSISMKFIPEEERKK